MRYHRYTDEEIDYLRKIAPGQTRTYITQKFNEKFNANLNEQQIKGALTRNNIATGYANFYKGMTPHNKGVKMSDEMYEKVKHTFFKKGTMPPNSRPVGSERISRDGYVEIKVAQPNKWNLKHIEVWQAHYGEIPQDCCIIFLDGDGTNVDISNLAMVSKSENLYLNKQKLRFKDKDLTQAAVNVAKLNSKVVQYRKKDN